MSTARPERRRRGILAETPGESLGALGGAPARRELPGDAVTLDSPLGRLDLVVGPRGIRALEFRDEAWEGSPHPVQRGAIAGPTAGGGSGLLLRTAVDRLEAYFRGDLDALDALEVDPEGTTFQKQVWKALRLIRAGRTVSYQELAARVGSPRAVRAVAACNARNPVAIVVPCHRVLGSDGSLTGYGGGLSRKRWLLEHERASGFLWIPPDPPAGGT
jgi:methylated-DNA-[protein]-cysteine S-methyltransferase